MTFLDVDVKIEVIDMKVRVPKKLKSLELDLPRGSYEFSKLRKFCRSKNQGSAVT